MLASAPMLEGTNGVWTSGFYQVSHGGLSGTEQRERPGSPELVPIMGHLGVHFWAGTATADFYMTLEGQCNRDLVFLRDTGPAPEAEAHGGGRTIWAGGGGQGSPRVRPAFTPLLSPLGLQVFTARKP